MAQSVLIASLPGDEQSAIDAAQRHPDRLWAYAMRNPLDPNASRAVPAGLRGICLFPAMHGYGLDDERALAAVEEISRTPGTVLFVHCGILTVGIRKKLGLPSLFDMRFSNPVAVHPVAMRFPSLPIVIPHFGAGYFREALMVCDLCPNVYLDTSSSNSWMRFQEPGCSLRSVFERALAVAGPRRLLFGTDSSFFPRGWHRAVFDQQTAVLREIGIGAEDAASILGGNLRRLLSGGDAPASPRP